MEDRLVLHEFERLARATGIRIRYTDDNISGLCTVKGERVIFMNNTLDEQHKIGVFVSSFNTIDLEGVFVIPAIRRLLAGDNHEDW